MESLKKYLSLHFVSFSSSFNENLYFDGYDLRAQTLAMNMNWSSLGPLLILLWSFAALFLLSDCLTFSFLLILVDIYDAFRAVFRSYNVTIFVWKL